MTEKIVDFEILEKISELFGEKFPGFFKKHFEGSEKLLKNIEKAIQDNNIEDMTLAAHTLKSSSCQLGIMALGKKVEEIEKIGLDNNGMGNANQLYLQAIKLHQQTKELVKDKL